MAEKEYIDKNELIDDFQNDLINLYFNGLKGTPRPKEIKIVNVIERIEDFPIADVQPVKHGHWIITDDVEHFIAVCSECGRTEDSRDIKDMLYCHCGARMDGKQFKHK